MAKKVLLIVEGDSDEVSFVKKLFSVCNRKIEYKIYSYRTNIHIIAQELYNNYSDFDKGDVDIRLFLAAQENDKNKKKLLLDAYSDIYMIFDFDPQHNHPHFDTIRRMIYYFTDSTNQGKLFINYPMMQSYKHFDKLPCLEFENTSVTMDEVNQYKKIVGDISCCTDLSKYSYHVFLSITVHHLKKANKILNDNYSIPIIDDYLEMNFGKLYDCQLSFLKKDKRIYVLNTCIFILIDFAPKKVFSYIYKHQLELSI